MVETTCRTCRGRRRLPFDCRRIQEALPAAADGWAAALRSCPGAAPLPVNSAEEPSRVIDVAGWLTLYAMAQEAIRQAADDARSPADRTLLRAMRIEAAQCLDEALKFFEPDNDLPPQDAFFTPDSLGQFRDRPELFTRQRLIDLRRQLPA